jgi:hypothetical protein
MLAAMSFDRQSLKTPEPANHQLSNKSVVTTFYSASALGCLLCVFLFVGLESGNTQPQPLTNASPQVVKAYKTLNFGDDTKTIEEKLPGFLLDGKERGRTDFTHSETLWRSFFDTDADYQPYAYEPGRTSQSKNLESLMRYVMVEVGIIVTSYQNETTDINCYELGSAAHRESQGLAVVEVNYDWDIDADKLSDTFTQDYPSALKQNKFYRIESTKYPGIFLEFERTRFVDIQPARRATLSLPTKKFSLAFTEPSNLSKDQTTAWMALMAQEGNTAQIKEYYEGVKTSLLEIAKKIETQKSKRRKLDPFTYLGWYDNNEYGEVIYGAPSAVFASRPRLGFYLNNYLQSTAAKKENEKAKLKKQSESATQF